MAERRGPRLVTQRRLEAAPPAAPPGVAPETVSVSAPPRSPSPPPTARPATEPVRPSNHALLERQLRWHRERAKFESGRPAPETPR